MAGARDRDSHRVERDRVMPFTDEQLTKVIADLQRDLKALEACGPGRADWIVRASQRLEWLETNHQKLEQLHSTLAADLARIDNKSQPAKGTTAQRLEQIELAIPSADKQLLKLYTAHQAMLMELAAHRAWHRRLIHVLQNWAPRGDADGLPERLEQLRELTGADLTEDELVKIAEGLMAENGDGLPPRSRQLADDAEPPDPES